MEEVRAEDFYDRTSSGTEDDETNAGEEKVSDVNYSDKRCSDKMASTDSTVLKFPEEGSPEVINLDQPITSRNMQKVTANENPRVIELSDRDSKMALHRQFNVDCASPARSDGDAEYSVTNDGATSLEILQKLPPGTVLIKQESSKIYQEDSDYVHESSKDSTETTSSGGSTTSGTLNKPKRIHRSIRSKKITEVRRNPVRVTKKDMKDKDFPRPRQRLLSVRRREGLVIPEASKRSKSTTMPYMNTRSVTRKLYTVGATYQAPTKRDETEWKEWPVHGMHERPIFHPEVGLAAGYNGRVFTSLDGYSYQEVVVQPEVEIVLVDPQPETSLEEKKKRKVGSKTKKGDLETNPEDESFVTCMHDTLHSVFAYCTEVISPSYKENVEKRIESLASTSKQSELTLEKKKMKLTNCKEIPGPPETLQKVKIKTENPKDEPSSDARKNPRNDPGIPKAEESRKNVQEVSKIAVPASSAYFFSRKPLSELSKMKNLPISQTKLQEVLQNSPRNTILLVRTAQSSKTEKVVTNNSKVPGKICSDLNLTKLEDFAISDETLMEISSVYKKLVPTEEQDPSCENSPKKGTIYKKIPIKGLSDKLIPKPIGINVARSAISSPKRHDNIRVFTTSESNSGRGQILCQMKDPRDLKCVSIRPADEFWNTKETSEIARILSEYNKSSVKRPAMQSIYCSAADLSSPKLKARRLKDSEITEELEGEKKPVGPSETTIEFKIQQKKWKELIASRKLEIKEKQQNSDFTVLTKVCQEKDSRIIEAFSSQCQIDQKDQKDQKFKEETQQKVTLEKPLDADDEKRVNATNGTQWLQELLEDTAVLYCAAAGVHQDDLVNYINTLDTKQSALWLKERENYV